MNNLDKLKELTNGLPEIPKLKELIGETDSSTHSILYDVEKGTSFGLSLLSRPQVAVQEVVISKGTFFPKHVHEKEREIIIVYKGKLEIIVEGENNQVLLPGDSIVFEPGKVHSSFALEDTNMITISIPRIEGYPK